MKPLSDDYKAGYRAAQIRASEILCDDHVMKARNSDDFPIRFAAEVCHTMAVKIFNEMPQETKPMRKAPDRWESF